jgi:hypothetical protein
MNRVALFTLITLLASLGCSKSQKPADLPLPPPPPEEEPAVREPAAPKQDSNVIARLEIVAADLAKICDQELTRVRLATWQPENKKYVWELGRCVGYDFDLLGTAAELARNGMIPPEDMPRLEELRTKLSRRILYRLAFMRCLDKFKDDTGLMKCMTAEGKKIKKELSTVPKTI